MMKKAGLITVISLIAFVISSSAFAQTKPNVYSVSLYVGDVKISHNSGKKWKTVQPEMELKEADTLKTGLESYCDILMKGRGSFRIVDNTQVDIKTLRSQLEQIKIKKGRAIFNIAKKLDNDQSFQVETTIGVAAVRGTEFVIDTSSDKMDVSVNTGKVAIKRNVKLPPQFANDPEIQKLLVVEAEANQSLQITMDENKALEQRIQSVKNNKAELESLLQDSQAATAKKLQIMKKNVNRVFDELNKYDEQTEDDSAPTDDNESTTPDETESDGDADSTVNKIKKAGR